MGREVTESLMESLMTVISSYCSGFDVNKPELAARRIEAIGFQITKLLIKAAIWKLLKFSLESRISFVSYTMDRPSFTDHLEAIKFICKEFWSELFKKQIDNLKTNHRGTFVLQDNRFRWLAAGSSMRTSGSIQEPAENKEAEAIGMHLYFPCGIIRGALSNLGIPCAVSADISNLPACSFVVRIKA